VLGVTRQGFYAWRRRGPSRHQLGDDKLAKLIVTIYDGSLQTYGAPRIQLELADEHGVHVGRKRVARLMRRLGLQGVSRRSKRRRTTVPDVKTPPAPDLVQRRFAAERPNQLWLADLTYVPTIEGYLFLGVVMDMCSRKIVGWSMRDDLKAELVVDALAMALTRRRPPAGLVHHSDRGSQYTSLAFGRTLRESGLVASMGSRGDAFDNAACESCISTLKEEWIKRHRYQSRDEARLSIFRYIETFYNPGRRHSSLGGSAPTSTNCGVKKDKRKRELIQYRQHEQPRAVVSTRTGQAHTVGEQGRVHALLQGRAVALQV
jgi:putative transposase